MFTLCPLTAGVLVRAVVAILVAVAEELLGDAGGVPAGELVVVTDRLVSHQQRLYLLLFCLLITIFHSPLPVTGLLLQVKGKAWGASDSLETLTHIRGKY